MSKYTKGVLITLLGGACWGLSGTCSQYLCSVQGMDTRWVTALRLLGAGVVLLLLAAVQQREQLQKLLRDKRAVLYCVVFGICRYGFDWLCLYFGNRLYFGEKGIKQRASSCDEARLLCNC